MKSAGAFAALALLLLAPDAHARTSWTVAAPEDVGIDAARLEGLPEAVALGRYPLTTSVLIVRDGQLAYEHYFGDGAENRLNDTRSATKTLVALAIGKAIESGAIASVDAPAVAFFSDLAPFANDSAIKRAITIADLLTSSSALDCDDNNETPGNEENMHPQQVWTRFVLDLPTKAGWTRDAQGRGPWAYCTAGSFLLGQIVERATGERVDRFMDRTLFQPLAITRRKWDQSPSGEFQTGGGLELTSRDLARIGWMMTDGGRWKGRSVVAPAWLATMMRPHRDAFMDMRYGYQMWTRAYQSDCGGVDVWFMAGNGGNDIVSIPALGAAAVVTRTDYNTRNMHQQTFDIIQSFIIPALQCRPRAP